MNLKSQRDLSGLFGVNPKLGPFAADHVPFGTYRIKIQSQSGPEVFERLIDVCEKDESVEVPSHFARVHVVVLNTTANSVEDAGPGLVRVAKFQSVDGTKMTSLFKGAVADEVPYGSYDLELFDPLGGVIKRRVDAFQQDVWVYSGLVARDGERPYSGPDNVVLGEVENIPANERPIFVTMLGVYVPHMINSRVSDLRAGTGTFSLTGVNTTGFFMLLTIGSSGILDTRELKLPAEGPIVVDLSHPNPPKVEAPSSSQTGGHISIDHAMESQIELPRQSALGIIRHPKFQM
ncbi:MAG: hypothetical protein WA789_06340 [Candidatus Acidiferrum sp.]